jgi:dihydroflavonol-4-reductase
MRILTTGSNGFIGSTLVERLCRMGHKVRCLIRKTSDLTWLQHLDVEYAYGDLLSPSSLIDLVKDIDIIFHLGGVTKAATEDLYFLGNFNATVNLLDACQKCGSENLKFVFVSSQSAGGPSMDGSPVTELSRPHPLSVYGKSKLKAELAVQEYGQRRPMAILRPPSVYGPKDKDLFVLFRSIHRGLLPVLGDGRQKVSLVHVDDLVDGILLAGFSAKSNGQIYYLTGEGEDNWLSICLQIAVSLQKRPLTIHIPLWALDIFSAVSVTLAAITKKPALLNRDKVLEMKQECWLCSSEKAKNQLGFQPKMDLATGTSMTVAWYKKAGWL